MTRPRCMYFLLRANMCVYLCVETQTKCTSSTLCQQHDGVAHVRGTSHMYAAACSQGRGSPPVQHSDPLPTRVMNMPLWHSAVGSKCTLTISIVARQRTAAIDPALKRTHCCLCKSGHHIHTPQHHRLGAHTMPSSRMTSCTPAATALTALARCHYCPCAAASAATQAEAWTWAAVVP